MKIFLMAVMVLVGAQVARADVRDDEVLRVALLHVLTREKIVEETTATRGKIMLVAEPNFTTPTTEHLFSDSPIRWEKHLETTIPQTAEAARNMIDRIARRNGWSTTTVFGDPRIIPSPPEESTKATRRRAFWTVPQRFRATPPGYSADGNTAVVQLAFSWSGNMHSGLLTCVLLRDGESWKIAATHKILWV